MDTGLVSSTWIERLILNLFSYSVVVLPIAFVVIVTRTKLWPASIQSNVLIQWFVYGTADRSASRSPTNYSPASTKLVPESQQSATRQQDAEPLLTESRRDRSDAANKPSVSNALGFLWCLIGLQISYLIWGLLQEKIMTTKYPVTRATFAPIVANSSLTSDWNLSDNNRSTISAATVSGDRRLVAKSNSTTNLAHQPSPSIAFHDSQFLVLINRIVAFVTSILALVLSQHKQSKLYQASRNSLVAAASHLKEQQQRAKPAAPLHEYLYCSLSNILSSWCQYEALKYINFPTQCLSKSCKVIPVMLMSKLLLRKKYPFVDYLCAFLLALGMFVFMFYQPTSYQHPPTAATDGQSGHDQANRGGARSGGNLLLSGVIILSLYLTFDSFTSNWQQSLYSRYNISNWQMMAAINFYSILLTLTSLYQLGNLQPAFKLVAGSSVLLRDLLLMSVMSSIGQMFVYHTIKRFGSVVFAVIMTLRQFLSILLSCAIYGHRFDLGSSFGLVLVFLVVGFQVWHKSSAAKQRQRTGARLTSASSSAEFGTRISLDRVTSSRAER